MANLTPGFYWVWKRGKSDKPTIARLTKNGGWEYMNSEHSDKLIGNKPYEIISRIEEPTKKEEE